MKNLFKIAGYIIIFFTIGAVAVFFIYKNVKHELPLEVPLLIGKSVTEASELLTARKFIIDIAGKESHEEIPRGHIIKQGVAAGKEIPEGTRVSVIVSSGHEIYTMPSFEGQPIEEAKLTLANLGIKIRKVTWVHSDTVSKDLIIAQRPLPGNVERNEVNFLVSQGSYEVSYRCPSFVNMTADDARTLANELGITLLEKDKGTKIIFQKPEAGAIINAGSSVEITLGRGWGMWF